MSLQLYELVGTDAARPFSPFCWRTRMALAHKGLSAESIPWCFTEKEAIAPHKSDKVPVLLDGDKPVVDSWVIANYLEDAYPDRPSLFGGEGGRAHGRMLNWWGDITVVGGIFPLIIADIPAHLKPVDAAYFRKIREARFGKPLEEVDGRPRQVRRRLSQIARSVAADAEDATLSRRRRAELCRLHRVRRVPVGARRSARSSCSKRTIRSMRGARSCSMRSTAWRENRRAIRCSALDAAGSASWPPSMHELAP